MSAVFRASADTKDRTRDFAAVSPAERPVICHTDQKRAAGRRKRQPLSISTDECPDVPGPDAEGEVSPNENAPIGSGGLVLFLVLFPGAMIAPLLLAPYAAWVSFVPVLNGAIWR